MQQAAQRAWVRHRRSSTGETIISRLLLFGLSGGAAVGRWMLCAMLCFGTVLHAEQKAAVTTVLVPVVVSQASGKPVLNLNASNFSVEGRKPVELGNAELIPAEAMNDPQHTIPVFVLYDAYFFPAPLQNMIGAELLQFLGDLAQNYSPVTLVVNTPGGLKLVYDFGTDPKVLAEALTALNNGGKVADPKVKEQLDRLKVLKTFVPAPGSLENQTVLQFAGLSQMAQVLGHSPNRKAVIWLTWNYRLGTGEYTTSWTGSSLSQDKTLSMSTGTRAETMSNNMADERYQSLPPLYEKTIGGLNTARISVFPLQLYDPSKTTLAMNDPSQQDTVEGLRQVAACTGGISFKDFRQTMLAQAIAQIRADFGPYYMLTLSTGDFKKTEWVPIKVKVNQDGLSLRTAPGFLGLSPSAVKTAGIGSK